VPDSASARSALPRQLARTHHFSIGAPSAFTLSRDGSTVCFLRSKAGDDPLNCLWAQDCTTGQERLLADPLILLAGASDEVSVEEQTRRERARELSSGIVGYAADDDGDLLAFGLSGQLWTVRASDGSVRRLPAAEPVMDPRPDPTGTRIGYTNGGAMRVIEADGTGDRAVATPEHEDISYGLAEHVASESMLRYRGYWWSPDGNSLLIARVDTSHVQRWYISDPAQPASPPRAMPYPLAGTANAVVSLWIADLTAAAERPARTAVDWDNTAMEYLTAAGWDGTGPYAAVERRDQQLLQILGIDAPTGQTSVLAEQRDDAWISLVRGLPARTASGLLVSSSDSGDTRRLTVGGQAVTPPGLQLDSVMGVDGERVVFTASDEPTQTHLWSYDSGDGLVRLCAEEAGVHFGVHRAGTTILVSRGPDRPGDTVTVLPAGRADRQPPQQIASHTELPVLDVRMELMSLGPGELRAALYLPSWYRDGDAPLPVLLDPYGGPAANKVFAEQIWLSYVSQWFAEQGFAVLVIDGRGTPGRGPAWERTVYLDFADPVLADQVAGLQAAAAQSGALDLSRVAIRGWSFGGFLSALAVLRRPDVFHAAVAGAPPTDQRLYDTHWRERFLGHPDEHPDAYDHCSLLADAASLRRPLLLVHGLADDNVFAAHTLRLSAALLAAGRPHEVLPLPGATHLVSEEAVSVNLLLHQLEFLQRALGLPGSSAP
jgi:dipeptidyl-peptidase-4